MAVAGGGVAVTPEGIHFPAVTRRQICQEPSVTCICKIPVQEMALAALAEGKKVDVGTASGCSQPPVRCEEEPKTFGHEPGLCLTRWRVTREAVPGLLGRGGSWMRVRPSRETVQVRAR